MEKRANGGIAMNRNILIIGGAVAGILAVVCVRILVKTLKETEKRT
jgi:hypothetical protein